MSEIQFDSPAKRIIREFEPKDKFGIQLLPDLAFLRQLAIQGRLVFAQGSITNTVGTAVEIIPANGSTLFVYRCTMSSSTAQVTTFEVQNDGQVRDIIVVAGSLDTTPNISALQMDSLVGDGVKSFRLQVVAETTGIYRGSIFGWIENTSRIRDVTT